MQKQPLRVWLYARTADARPGVLEEQLNSLYREAERRGYTVVNGGAEHRCAGDLDRPALFAMLAAVRGGADTDRRARRAGGRRYAHPAFPVQLPPAGALSDPVLFAGSRRGAYHHGIRASLHSISARVRAYAFGSGAGKRLQCAVGRR